MHLWCMTPCILKTMKQIKQGFSTPDKRIYTPNHNYFVIPTLAYNISFTFQMV